MIRRFFFSCFLILATTVPISQGWAQMIDAGERLPGASGLPLPRFVSLASGEANMRTGPGEQYPILWTYIRRTLPLEITAEYGNWRRVRDKDGTQGWMHSALLSGARTALVTGGTRSLYGKPRPTSTEIMRAESGVIVSLDRCLPQWCRVSLAGRTAWINRTAIWGTYRDEVIE